MLTLDERRTAERHITTIALYDRNAGALTRQVWTLAQHHSDEAARIWLSEMSSAVRAINVTKHTQIGTTAQQVLDGRLILW